MFTATEIPDVLLYSPERFGDQRGWFRALCVAQHFADQGLPSQFCQDNHSFSSKRGTVRGLHWQATPAAQDKLIFAIKGEICDCAVDLRPTSPHFGKYVLRRLSAENGDALWIPKGFAHGFCTLEDDCEILYKVTAPYAPQSERGIMWNDTTLQINWPDFAGSTISKRDQTWPDFVTWKSLQSQGGE